MPYERVKDFTAGGTVTPNDLNNIQDDYLERFADAATGGFGTGPIANRPTAESAAGRGWLDDAGTEWRSNGVAWVPVGGRLPSARLHINTPRAIHAASLDSWNVAVTDRVAVDANGLITAAVAGRYMLTLVMDLSMQLSSSVEVYVVNYYDANTPERWFIVRPWSTNNTYVSRTPVAYTTTTDLVPVAVDPNSYIEVGISSTVSTNQIVSAELNLQMISA